MSRARPHERSYEKYFVDALPSTKNVIHTNRCHLTARVVGSRVTTISAIDNLIKGAAGAAVQNFNVICGFDETTALLNDRAAVSQSPFPLFF